MQHIIKKQVINLMLNKKMDAFSIQHLVSEHYWREIVPVLQKAFDAASSEDEIIQLDKLEIDLGIINLKDIEKGRWEENVFKKISEQLSIAATHISPAEKITKQSASLSIAEQWMFYMQHGYLPWSVLKIDANWYQKALEAFAGDSATISKLRYLIQKDINAVKRIIFQHPESFLKALIETLTAEKQDMLSKIIDEIAEVVSFLNQGSRNITSVEKKQLKQILWQQVLQFAASEEKDLNAEKLATILLQNQIKEQESIQKLPRNFLFKKRVTAAVLKQLKEAPEHAEKKKREDKIVRDDESEIDKTIRVDEEGIFVQHAGLVLLHPFLNRFFTNLQLIKEENFADAQSHQRALHLLHYLATENTAPEEHELVIAKILCNYPLEEPVDGSIELMANELGEANDLLIETIQQWEILKGTSVAGLREGFLQRSGKLYTKNYNLHLQVESNSIDVLLDHLPWNVSLVKLPWMKDILRVEWR